MRIERLLEKIITINILTIISRANNDIALLTFAMHIMYNILKIITIDDRNMGIIESGWR